MGGMLWLRVLCRSDMTKDELEAELNSNTRILLWSGILIGTLSIGILGYALVRYCDSI